MAADRYTSRARGQFGQDSRNEKEEGGMAQEAR